MLVLTIRQCVEEMKKVGNNQVWCYNGTRIILNDLGVSKGEHIGRIKWNPDGSIRVIRGFFCTILPTSRTVGLEKFRKDENIWLYDPEDIDDNGYDHNFFRENDYYIKERMMNEFISDNGGIDHYETVTKYAYMIADMQYMQNEFDKLWED